MIKVENGLRLKSLIVIISILLIPVIPGNMAATKVNYDILSYLPDSLETMKVRTSWWMNSEWCILLMIVNMDLKTWRH